MVESSFCFPLYQPGVYSPPSVFFCVVFSSHLQNRSKFAPFFLNLLVFLVSSEELEMLTNQFLKVLCQKPYVCKCGCAVWKQSVELLAAGNLPAQLQLPRVCPVCNEILCELLSCTSVKRGEKSPQNWSCVLTTG